LGYAGRLHRAGSNVAGDLSRIAGDDSIRRDIAGDHGAGANLCPFSNHDAWQERGIGAD
jgi:hypothetical protein